MKGARYKTTRASDWVVTAIVFAEITILTLWRLRSRLERQRT
jgi:hypothetical protein